MKNKLIKVLLYIIAALIGLILGISGFDIDIEGIAMTIVSIALVVILEVVFFATIHELSHGLVAEKNGLKFTVLYI